MSISPSRAQARLAITKTKIAEIEALIKKHSDLHAEAMKPILEIELLLAENKSDESQLIGLAASHEIQIGRLTQDLMPYHLMNAAQETALAVITAAYPQKLARHLRKCKKFGWSDSRLKGGKK